jgi:hypothetical protein
MEYFIIDADLMKSLKLLFFGLKMRANQEYVLLQVDHIVVLLMRLVEIRTVKALVLN